MMYEGVKYMNNNFNNFGNEFSSMNDLFNQLMGNMGGYSTERRSYKINGREVTPEEFAFIVKLVDYHLMRKCKLLKLRNKVK